jgi:hypothetical protein
MTDRRSTYSPMRRSSAPFGIEPGIDKVVVLGSTEELPVRDLAVFTADLIWHLFDNTETAKRQSYSALAPKIQQNTEALSHWSLRKSFEFGQTECACALARELLL